MGSRFPTPRMPDLAILIAVRYCDIYRGGLSHTDFCRCAAPGRSAYPVICDGGRRSTPGGTGRRGRHLRDRLFSDFDEAILKGKRDSLSLVRCAELSRRVL